MADLVALPDARAHFDDLVRRAASHRVTITDQGRAAAVLVSLTELADLDEAAALARYRDHLAAGDLRTFTHAEAHARLATTASADRASPPECRTSLVWTEHVLDSAAGYLASDPTGLTQAPRRVGPVAGEPRPESSTAYRDRHQQLPPRPHPSAEDPGMTAPERPG